MATISRNNQNEHDVRGSGLYMTQGNEETDSILKKYGDLMSEEEKNELLGNDQMSCAPPVISSSYAKRGVSSIVLDVILSVFFFNWFNIELLFHKTTRPPILSTGESYFCFYLSCLVFVPQFLRLKWRYRDEDRDVSYVRVLIAISLAWLLFNSVFYFTSSPLLILSCALLILAELIVHSPFPGMQSVKFVQMAQRAVSRVNCSVVRRKTRSNAASYLFKALCSPLELMKKIVSHSPRSEPFSLLYIGMVSLLCLFSIAGVPWIAAIFVLFWYIAVNRIEQFKAPRKLSFKFLRPVPKSEQMDNQINRYFHAVVRTPLGIFHSVGTTCFLGLFIYVAGIRKMHLASLFSLWGVFLWNIVMVEIQLYAKDKQKKRRCCMERMCISRPDIASAQDLHG
jgi:hypothetical protein